MSKLCQKLSKLYLGFSCVSFINLPPNTCIPRSENITINKKSRSNKDAIDCIEFNKDATKFESERQYLQQRSVCNHNYLCVSIRAHNYFVTLKTLSNLTQRSTEMPKGGIRFDLVRTVSVILPITTKQSKRLNNDTK